MLDEEGRPIELGHGAMGVTYKALDVDLRCAVTLKVISERYLGDQSARLRFLREARAAASVRHPNVASVLHLGRTGSSYFYAMEFVEGETVEHLIRRSGRVEVKLALEIATQMAAGLAAVNKRQLVHRDIKPSNIMVSLEEGGAVTVKIIDLGLAKGVEESGSQTPISIPGIFAGTPEFASPEQFAGIQVDIRSDLYSLGVTLWKMLTGQTPFQGTCGEVMYQHQHAPLPLEQLKGVPQPIVTLLVVLLEKDPARRFQNPAELLKALPALSSAIEGRRRITRQSVQKTPSTASRVGTRRPPARLAPKKIFGWSFYRQGSSGDTSSSDEFLDAALNWFGDPDPRLGTAWEKGERLAKLVAHRRTLLVLDGLEPLQNPPGPQEGRLRSQQADAWKECNKRLFHYYRTLAPQLPNSFRETEPLFSAVICGCNAGLFREALHEVYIPRIQRGDSSFAANVLGARGALLLVLAHFFEHGRWGSLVETAVEGQSLNGEDQLFIVMQAGSYLTATRGLGAPDARICYERAEPLCHSLGRPLLLCVALIGQWRYSLHTGKLRATMQIAQRIHSLAQEQNDAALMIEAYRVLAVTLYCSGAFETAQQYAMRAVQIWRSGNVQSRTEGPQTPVVVCLCYRAGAEWHLGEIGSYQATIAEAISLAKELNDMNALAMALAWAAGLAANEGSPAEVERLASDLIELCTRHSFVFWLAIGVIYRGWARSASGNTAEGIAWIEQGIRDYRATGAVLGLTYYLGRKAEALYLADRTSEALEALNEAEALAERSEQRDYCARLHWLRGVFLATLGAEETQIEASFCAAIRIGKEQKSISLATRAEATYAEYRRQKPSGANGRNFRLPLW
jgi:serine/threonine protein kinase